MVNEQLKKYPLEMESEKELQKRIDELEKGLAQEKWQRDIERQNAQQAKEHTEWAKKEKAYNDRVLYIFIGACALPFLILLLK